LKEAADWLWRSGDRKKRILLSERGKGDRGGDYSNY
jgi:hypothetical protein